MNAPVAGAPAPPAVRVYAAMLRLLPREFRHSYGAAAGEVFDDMYREARGRSLLAGLRLWAWATSRLVFCAVGERWQDRRATGAGPASLSIGDPPPRRNREPSEMFATLLQDLRYAGRAFAKKPAFALSAILIVAVGIGATTTIFSVVDAVLLRRLPYPEPDRVIFFTEGAHSFPDYNEWTKRLDAFSAIAGVWDERVDVTTDGPPEQVDAARVSPEFFSMFGATPHLGRFFAREEFTGDPTVAALGYGIWQRRWGADPSIVGKTVTIDGQPLTIVGIVGPEFQPPEALSGQRVDVWLPLDVARPEYLENMGLHVMGVAGRLADGASIEVAQEQIDAFTAWRAEEYPNRYLRDGKLRVVPLLPLREATVEDVSATLYLLLGAVGFMLLIACANVANLFLARGTERAREIALRGALGASRGRLVGQLLTESVAVAVVGGIGGVIVAFLGVTAFARFNPGNIPRLYDVAVDPRVLGFAFLASLATGVLFGILPALQAARTDVNEMLKEGAANVTAGRQGRRTRGLLVVAEIALALILLVGAGLLFRSLMKIVSVDPGFETEQLVDLSLQLGPTFTEAERVAFANQVIERIETLPGTEAASAGWSLPFVHHGGSRCCWRTSVRDATQPPADEELQSWGHPVTPGYFAMLGAPLRHGRDFVKADNTAEPSVAVINLHMAREVFGTDNAVGRTLVMGDESELTVVGVVEGIQHYGLSQEIDNATYVPYERFGGELPLLHIGVRSRADFETVVAGMREAVWALEPDLPIQDIVTMRERVADSLATPRFLSLLLGVFAGVALLLACGGIYGSMLYSVSQRQREMGIRLALGAAGGNVIRLILGHGLLLTVLGLSIGIAGSLALSRLMSSVMTELVWGIEPTDPLTFVGVTLALAVAALAACFFPAYKASRADPLQTLRAE